MIPLPAATTKFFDAVVQATLWTLWRFRNDMIFASKRPNKRLILDNIKLSSFTWCSSRQKKVPGLIGYVTLVMLFHLVCKFSSFLLV